MPEAPTKEPSHAERERGALPACPVQGCTGRVVATEFDDRTESHCDRCGATATKEKAPPPAAVVAPKPPAAIKGDAAAKP